MLETLAEINATIERDHVPSKIAAAVRKAGGWEEWARDATLYEQVLIRQRALGCDCDMQLRQVAEPAGYEVGHWPGCQMHAMWGSLPGEMCAKLGAKEVPRGDRPNRKASPG